MRPGIALYARRKRFAERWGVTTADSKFEISRLPPGNASGSAPDMIAIEPEPDREPHVLGVASDAPDSVVKDALRELVKEGHADQSGNDAYDVAELKRAGDALLD